MKKMLNEGNQIHNFISSSGSGTVINYGSGSDFLTSYGSGSGSTVKKLRFLRFRFRFYNAVCNALDFLGKILKTEIFVVKRLWSFLYLLKKPSVL
jgi:hypothetical protein